MGILGVGMLYSISRINQKKKPKPKKYKTIQLEALSKLYFATNGDHWIWPESHKKAWSETEDVCQWIGVICEDPLSGIITGLNFINRAMDGTIPTEIGSLSSLKNLVITKNEKLRGAIPSELGNLKRLIRLQLSMNGLTGDIPSEIGKLEMLFHLQLQKNHLTGSLPSSIMQLSGLEKLVLNGNQIGGDASKDSMICNMRDDVGGSLNYLWLDCDKFLCECCTKC